MVTSRTGDGGGGLVGRETGRGVGCGLTSGGLGSLRAGATDGAGRSDANVTHVTDRDAAGTATANGGDGGGLVAQINNPP
ncbi:hypothetical protein [Magnetospirillum fulvum]|uniref:Uncharacterized protein n=1 Tax=Magnetospirillum fulvum MGU-K5 TaxID=1316936 RepID=S9S762_MAGFU|nr:hypothetical protein [Magnetospirillum fulvum]EPY01697.1 hypothetical protein K678_09600 [Magnetospirillum fulvum MGU-K5]